MLTTAFATSENSTLTPAAESLLQKSLTQGQSVITLFDDQKGISVIKYLKQEGDLIKHSSYNEAEQFNLETEWVNAQLFRQVKEIKNKVTQQLKLLEIYYRPQKPVTVKEEDLKATPKHPAPETFSRLWLRNVESNIIQNEIYEFNGGKKGKLLKRFQDSFDKPVYKSDELPKE
jgi:hypothetical protein